MRKTTKVLFLLTALLLSWNIFVKDGSAASNTISNAEELPLESEYYLELDVEFTNKDLIDNGKYGKYYKFTVPTDRYFDLAVNGWNGFNDYEISILDSNGHSINIPTEIVGHRNKYTQHLTPGTYYIFITTENLSQNIYLSGNIIPFESEPNGTLKAANELTPNTKNREFYNHFASEFSGENGTDVDYFKFTLSEDSGVYFSVHNELIQDDITLLDDKGKPIPVLRDSRHPFSYGWGDTAVLTAGTYYLKITSTPETYGTIYFPVVELHDPTTPVNANDVIVSNNISNDTITMNNLTAFWYYGIYQYNLNAAGEYEYSRIDGFLATNTREIINTKQLEKQGGSIFVSAWNWNQSDSPSSFTEVKYNAEKTLGITPTIASSNISITNNYNEPDVITFKNLQVGSEYTIYKDSAKKTKLDSFEAVSSTNSIEINDLGAAAGSIYVTATKREYSESTPTKVNYAAEIRGITPVFPTKNVTVTNNYNKKDVISFKNLVKGSIYTIYKDSSKKSKLKSFEATSSTESINLDQLGAAAGSIYITATHPYYSESKPSKIDYAAEIRGITPSIATKNVTITNNFNNKDTLSFKNLLKDSIYTIYKDAAKKTKLATFKASKTTASITINQLGATAGSIYVTVTAPNYSVSKVTKVNYAAEKLPAFASKNLTITNNISDDKLVLKGLTKGYTYTIYTDAALKKRLTIFTATGTTKTLNVKQVGAKAGAVYVVVSKSGYLSSAPTKVSYKGQPTAALSSKNVTVTNAKKQDTIKLKSLKKGVTYVIYKDAAKKTKLTSFKATGTSKTITVKQLGTKAGKIYITAQEPGYNVSAPTTVSYSKEK